MRRERADWVGYKGERRGNVRTLGGDKWRTPANDAPPIFNTRLYDNVNREDSIHRSKAVGEPPLLLPFSVFFAIRDAVASTGGPNANPPLTAPATSGHGPCRKRSRP